MTFNELRTSLGVSDGYIWQEQHCPICGDKPQLFVGMRGGASHRDKLGIECKIWKCKICGLVFPNPMPVPEKGLGQHYDVDADEYFSAHDTEKKLENALSLVTEAENLLGRKGRLLDVGVGRGEVMKIATDRGWEVEGVEPSRVFAERAEQITGSKIWRTSIEMAEIPSGSFDVVILAAVLEHLYEPAAIVGKISEVLKNGGLLYLDVPNESGLYFRLGNLYQRVRMRSWCVNLAPTFSPYHVFGFNKTSLVRLLEMHSLKPSVWRVYGGSSLVPRHSGFIGSLESLAAWAITRASNYSDMGTFIETWAVKESGKA